MYKSNILMFKIFLENIQSTNETELGFKFNLKWFGLF